MCSAWLARWPRRRNSVAAQSVAGFYTTLIRGVPDLVLMLLIFFGGQWWSTDRRVVGYEDYIDVSPSSPAC